MDGGYLALCKPLSILGYDLAFSVDFSLELDLQFLEARPVCSNLLFVSEVDGEGLLFQHDRKEVDHGKQCPRLARSGWLLPHLLLVGSIIEDC